MEIRGLFQQKQSGFWYYQSPQVNGVRKPPVSLKTKDQNEAIKRYLVISKQAAAQIQPSRASFEIERHLAEKLQKRLITKATATKNRLALEMMVRKLGNLMVAEYTVEMLASWRDEMFARGLSTSTVVDTYLTPVSTWFNWLKRQNLVAENPVEALDLPRMMPTRSERYCTVDERETLIATADNPDLLFVLWTGFFAGLRRLEIVEARPDWFADGQTIRVQHTPTFTPKDKEARVIPMSPRLAAFIADYGLREPFMARPKSTHGRYRYRWDFATSFRNLRNKCGLPWVTPHTMRHTFATLHALAGTPLIRIAKWLGDEVSTTEKNYIGYQRSHDHSGAID